MAAFAPTVSGFHGNRSQHSRDGTGDFSFTMAPSSNRLSSWSGSGRFRHFHYDAVGNVEREERSDGERRYSYDAFDRMNAIGLAQNSKPALEHELVRLTFARLSCTP